MQRRLVVSHGGEEALVGHQGQAEEGWRIEVGEEDEEIVVVTVLFDEGVQFRDLGPLALHPLPPPWAKAVPPVVDLLGEAAEGADLALARHGEPPDFHPPAGAGAGGKSGSPR